jgi:hypothetical protein
MGPCVVSYLGEAATSPAPVAAFSWGFGFRPQISYVRFMPIAAASASPPGWLRCSIVTAHRMSPRAFGRYAPCLTNFCSRFIWFSLSARQRTLGKFLTA